MTKRKNDILNKKDNIVTKNIVKKKQTKLKKKKESIEKNEHEANSISLIDKQNLNNSNTGNMSEHENIAPECNSSPVVENNQNNSFELTYNNDFPKSMLDNCMSTCIQRSEISEILARLTELENKMNLNEYGIETSTCNEEKLISSNQQVNIEEGIKCTDAQYQKNNIEKIESQEKTTDMDTNINDACGLNYCVCKLIGNKKSNVKIRNSNNNMQNINNDSITHDFKYNKPCDDSFKIIPDNVNLISNPNNEKKNTDLSICSNKINLSINDRVNVVKFDKKSKSHYVTNTICDFLLSQPTPEWIGTNEKDETSKMAENQCESIINSQENISSSSFKCRKLYNIERTVKGM